MRLNKILIIIAVILLFSHTSFAQIDKSTDVIPESIMNTNLQSLNGTYFRLSEGQWKVKVILLWGSWCPPCWLSADELNKVYRNFAKRDVEIIGLTSEDPRKERRSVLRFVRSHRIRFKIGWIDMNLATIMAPKPSVPQILVITHEGRVVKRFIGYNPIQNATLTELNEIVGRYSSKESLK